MTTQPAAITIEPIVSYPREAEPGKTYLMTVDLRFPMDAEEWPYDEEEHDIYCLLDTAPLFDNEALGESAIVLHRFGGTYGPAMFLLTANQIEMSDPVGSITLTLANRHLMPLQVFKLDKIRISTQLAPSLAKQRVLRSAVKTVAPDGGVEKFRSSEVKAARPVHRIVEAAAAPESFNDDARPTGDQTMQSEAAAPHTLRVTIVHGDLRQASYPVAIGHFQGDIITGSEKVLDQALGGRLSQRFQTGIYPWAEGTNEVILLASNQPSGALVIGLGEFGELTREKLRDGVARAALRHALAIAERSEEGSSATSVPRSAAFSSLLIGSFTGDVLSVASSAQAIIEGAMEANRALSAQNLSEQVLVDRVEIVELYEDIAIQALHAVRDFAEQLPGHIDRGIRIDVAPQHLISRQGGLLQRPPSFSSVNRWLRFLISGAPTRQAEESGGSASSFAAELRFQTADKREAVVSAIQRQLVDRLIASSVQQTTYDERLGRTLSELLIPVSFISQAASQKDLLLILDREAARYPWEMLTPPKQTGPLALSHGMVRQFKTTGFRPAFHSQREQNVLVIGDADGKGLADLPGARAEAEEVMKTLNAMFKVWSKIKAPAIATIEDLFAREYRILHIAAHASYDEQNPERSGIVLGDGLFLTAAELRQLSVTPDLVFINCGHLGKIDGSPASGVFASLPLLAASLAEELIGMGVRIVITSGWAVDDQAAIIFAKTFYETMLNGIAFGDAVTSARKACSSRHPRVNTWGAYQCYGDPDFRLGGSRPTVA